MYIFTWQCSQPQACSSPSSPTPTGTLPSNTWTLWGYIKVKKTLKDSDEMYLKTFWFDFKLLAALTDHPLPSYKVQSSNLCWNICKTWAINCIIICTWCDFTKSGKLAIYYFRRIHSIYFSNKKNYKFFNSPDLPFS